MTFSPYSKTSKPRKGSKVPDPSLDSLRLLTVLRPHPESPLPWAVEPEPAEIEDYAGNTFASIVAAGGMMVATSLWTEDAEFIVALVNAALPMLAAEREQLTSFGYGRHDENNPECMCESCRSIAAEDNPDE